MKTTKELIHAFGKGQSSFKMTEKQAQWLFDLARKSKNIKEIGKITIVYISGTNQSYHCKPLKIPAGAYGGGTASKGFSGRYSVQRMNEVEFSGGSRQLLADDQVKDCQENGCDFEPIIY